MAGRFMVAGLLTLVLTIGTGCESSFVATRPPSLVQVAHGDIEFWGQEVELLRSLDQSRRAERLVSVFRMTAWQRLHVIDRWIEDGELRSNHMWLEGEEMRCEPLWSTRSSAAIEWYRMLRAQVPQAGVDVPRSPSMASERTYIWHVSYDPFGVAGLPAHVSTVGLLGAAQIAFPPFAPEVSVAVFADQPAESLELAEELLFESKPTTAAYVDTALRFLDSTLRARAQIEGATSADIDLKQGR